MTKLCHSFILSAASYTYDGSARGPAVTVQYNGKTLTSGRDYTVSYSNNINAGTNGAKMTYSNFKSTGSVKATYKNGKITFPKNLWIW